MGCPDSSAAILSAAGCVAHGALVGCRERAVALVGCLANTAGVRQGGGDREHERNEGSDDGEQQQESGGQALHAFFRKAEPKVGLA